MRSIKSIDIGVVKSIVKGENSYLVTIDNNVSAHVPLDHPVKDYFIDQPICFPHFKNDAIALVAYSDGTSDWVAARIAVSIDGEVVIGGTRYDFKDATFERVADSPVESDGGTPCPNYAYVSSMPVPSAYGLYLDSQFFKHNFDTIKEALSDASQVRLVDMAYDYSRELGYSLIYIQPTRFTLEYCEQAGIPTDEDHHS